MHGNTVRDIVYSKQVAAASALQARERKDLTMPQAHQESMGKVSPDPDQYSPFISVIVIFSVND